MRGVGKGFRGAGKREKEREGNGKCALIAGGDHFVG